MFIYEFSRLCIEKLLLQLYGKNKGAFKGKGMVIIDKQINHLIIRYF